MDHINYLKVSSEVCSILGKLLGTTDVKTHMNTNTMQNSKNIRQPTGNVPAELVYGE